MIHAGISPSVNLVVEAWPYGNQKQLCGSKIMRKISNNQTKTIRIAQQIEFDCPATAQICNTFDLAESLFDNMLALSNSFNE